MAHVILSLCKIGRQHHLLRLLGKLGRLGPLVVSTGAWLLSSISLTLPAPWLPFTTLFASFFSLLVFLYPLLSRFGIQRSGSGSPAQSAGCLAFLLAFFLLCSFASPPRTPVSPRATFAETPSGAGP